MVIARSLSGFFCDDIREELYGKRSIIGCYSGRMEVSSFPLVLPKLCVHVIVQSPATKPFGDVKLVVYRDEEILGEGVIPGADQSSDPPPEDTQMQRMDIQFIFAPLPIAGPCCLRVRAYTDGEELRGLALQVQAAALDPR